MNVFSLNLPLTNQEYDELSTLKPPSTATKESPHRIYIEPRAEWFGEGWNSEGEPLHRYPLWAVRWVMNEVSKRKLDPKIELVSNFVMRQHDTENKNNSADQLVECRLRLYYSTRREKPSWVADIQIGDLYDCWGTCDSFVVKIKGTRFDIETWNRAVDMGGREPWYRSSYIEKHIVSINETVLESASPFKPVHQTRIGSTIAQWRYLFMDHLPENFRVLRHTSARIQQ